MWLVFHIKVGTPVLFLFQIKCLIPKQSNLSSRYVMFGFQSLPEIYHSEVCKIQFRRKDVSYRKWRAKVISCSHSNFGFTWWKSLLWCNFVPFFFFFPAYLLKTLSLLSKVWNHTSIFPWKMKAEYKVEWLIFKIMHLKNNEGSFYQLYGERLLNYLLDRIWW